MNDKRTQRRRLILVILLALLACLAFGALAWSWLWNNLLIPPGEGPQAERGYREAGPVLQAIDRYYTDTGEYPQSLEELVPEYLHQVSSNPDGVNFVYHKTEDSFSLGFAYTGPGMNQCVYTPETDWECSGYY